MNKRELIIQTIEDLDAIDFYDRTMFHCGIINREVLSNMVTQDALLQRLERLDADAYLSYLIDDRDVINKYYSRTEETA